MKHHYAVCCFLPDNTTVYYDPLNVKSELVDNIGIYVPELAHGKDDLLVWPKGKDNTIDLATVFDYINTEHLYGDYVLNLRVLPANEEDEESYMDVRVEFELGEGDFGITVTHMGDITHSMNGMDDMDVLADAETTIKRILDGLSDNFFLRISPLRGGEYYVEEAHHDWLNSGLNASLTVYKKKRKPHAARAALAN